MRSDEQFKNFINKDHVNFKYFKVIDELMNDKQRI